MKMMLLLLSLTASSIAHADSYEYFCQSQNQGWEVEVTLTDNELSFDAEGGRLVYENTGPKGGSTLSNGQIGGFMFTPWENSDSLRCTEWHP